MRCQLVEREFFIREQPEAVIRHHIHVFYINKELTQFSEPHRCSAPTYIPTDAQRSALPVDKSICLSATSTVAISVTNCLPYHLCSFSMVNWLWFNGIHSPYILYTYYNIYYYLMCMRARIVYRRRHWIHSKQTKLMSTLRREKKIIYTVYLLFSSILQHLHHRPAHLSVSSGLIRTLFPIVFKFNMSAWH